MKRKLKSSRGLSLVETLCAVLILILLGLMVNTGLNMALNSYREITAQAEAELLLSTLADALADDLRYARDVKVETVDGKEVVSYNSDSYNGENGHASFRVDEKTGQLLANDLRVLPEGVYGNGAYRVSDFKLTYADGVFQLVLEIQQAEGDISVGTELSVRCLNP